MPVCWYYGGPRQIKRESSLNLLFPGSYLDFIIYNPKPPNPKSPKPQTLNPKPGTPKPLIKTLNPYTPKPQTLNPKPLNP